MSDALPWERDNDESAYEQWIFDRDEKAAERLVRAVLDDCGLDEAHDALDLLLGKGR